MKLKMKITIDTKEDSHEEIRKIIRMLSSLVGETVMTNQSDIFSNSPQDASTQTENSNMFNMFSANSVGENTGNADSEKKPVEDKKQQELDIDFPELEPYG